MLTSPVLLSYFPQITRARARKLKNHFASFDEVFSASQSELLDAGWKEDIASAFIIWRDALDESTLERELEAEGITPVSIEDEEYPASLKDIFDPPLCLFVRGNLTRYHTSLAVVGSRRMSNYGKLVIERLIPPITNAGVTIVSGLALGINANAHAQTVAVGGHAIAVLGGGVDRRTVAPAANSRLADKILETGGAIISEYPPRTKPTKYSFPERNRIIAALSKATLVIEAAQKSGSLITASLALEYGKEICAVPHPIHAITGQGTNQLIQSGAHMITEAKDILTLFKISEKGIPKPSVHLASLTEESRSVYTLLQKEALHIDVVIREKKLPSAQAMSIITILEMNGYVRNMGNMMYIAL